MVEWNGIFRLFIYLRLFRMKFRKMSVPFAYPSGIIGIFDRRWNERQIILFPGLLFLSYFNDTFLYIGTSL